MKNGLSFLILSIALLAIGCKKEGFFKGNAKLRFSTDTILFDTVFTTVGSITQRVKVYNPYRQPVKISQVSLKNGQASNFRLNVDGFQGKFVRDVEIAAEDSIFVFVEVTVDPNGGTAPLVIEDQILFETNGSEQDVDLVAWGQDAYFYPYIEFTDGLHYTLPIDKPNVFYGYAVIDTGFTLEIPAGCQVHFHANAGLIAGHEATLLVKGTQDNPVIIQGDRLETFFEDLPGQWDQILLSQTSRDNVIEHAIIKNGIIGVVVDSNSNANPTLTMNNVQILNMSYIGLFGRDSRIVATNTVVANCGDHTVALAYGGNYDFTHCTFANYYSANPRSKSVLLLNNTFEGNGTTYARDLQATFTNCIVTGSQDSEIELERNDAASFGYMFHNSVITIDTEEEETYEPEHYVDCRINAGSINFSNISEGDYSLLEGSSAINIGTVTAVSLDIEGVSRDSAPDAGAYEFQP